MLTFVRPKETRMNYSILKDEIARKVIDFYAANPPVWEQIIHTQAVASYARLIAAGEGMDEKQVNLHEIAAWLHDIGCPAARKLYGNSQPVHQQTEGEKLAVEWLAPIKELPESEKQWLAKVVGTHHEQHAAHSLHFEPLFEADLIVNLIEGYYAMEKAPSLYEKMVTTATGKALFEEIILNQLPHAHS